MPLWLRFVLFFLTLAVAMSGLNVLVHRRASRVLGLGKRGRRTLTVALVASGLMLVLGRVLGMSYTDSGTVAAVAATGFMVQLAVLIAAILMLPVELARLLGGLFERFGRRRTASTPADATKEPAARAEPDLAPAFDLGGAPPLSGEVPSSDAPSALALSRRELLSRAAWGGALLVGSGCSTYGALIGRTDFTLEELPVALPGLPRTLDGYTIVQISDVHFGTFVGEPEMRAAEDLVRSARPDLIVLTGDMVDHDPRYADMAARMVQRLSPLARNGVAAIAGNHDYYAGVEEVMSKLRSAGAAVLMNGGRVIGDAGGAFALLGVDDVWAQRNGFEGGPDLDRALSMVPDDLPRVLLCHNPSFFPEARGKVGLMLSGHTHGGQVSVGINPAELVLPHGYVRGRYEAQGSVLYVNRGFGTAGPPARVGSPPEITRIVLTV